MKQVRTLVSQADNNLPLFDVRTQTQQIEQMLYQERLMSRLSSFFAVLALILACIGLYGLLSASVTQRRGEIGVRIALGATPGMVLRMILSEALALLGLGMLLGSLGLSFAMRFVGSMLHEVSAYDPTTLAAVATTLVIVTILAAIVPALRAAKLDPVESLRYE